MSKAELQEILEEGDKEKCLTFFKGMSEKQRRNYAPDCIKWYRKVIKDSYIEMAPGSWGQNPLVPATSVAVFATATFSELKKLGWQARERGDTAYEMLMDRNPDWIESYANMLLEERQYVTEWYLIRRLIREGVISKPDHPHYYLGMLGSFTPGFQDDGPTIEQKLLTDPDLMESDFWKLFEYDGDSDTSFTNCDRWNGKQTWTEAILSLMNSGHLSRERLISCSLDALERDFNHYRAKWFSGFHDELHLTEQESRAYATRYLHLLGVSAPNIVTWAYKKVSQFAKGGAYDLADLIEGLRPVLGGRSKGNVKKALKLMQACAKQVSKNKKQITPVPQIAHISVVALGHEAADVQVAAFDTIDLHGSLEDTELVSLISDYAALIEPSVRPRLSRWLEPDENSSDGQVAMDEIDPAELDELNLRYRQLYSIDILLKNIEDESMSVPAAIFDAMDLPQLNAVEPVVPIDNVEELIDLCTHLIEEPGNMDDVERAIDGLARLSNQKPDNFEGMIGPLLKRVKNLFSKQTLSPFLGIGPNDDLGGLIYAWCTGIVLEGKIKKNEHKFERYCIEIEGVEYQYHWQNKLKAIGFLSRRSLALAHQLATGKTATMLSVPTHSNCWIDPIELVRRINQYPKEQPDITDLCLAMLRLAPENRDVALEQLKENSDEWRQAVHYALGACDIKKMGKTSALWITAARARSPWKDDAKVDKAFRKQGPDAGLAASYRYKYFTSKHKHTSLLMSTTSKPPKKVNPDCVTVIFHSQNTAVSGLDWELGGSGGRTAGAVRWTNSIWLSARESMFAAAAIHLAWNLDWHSAEWQNKTLLEPLLDPGVPLKEMGLLLLVITLAAKDPGEYGLATDITIAAIEDGRLGSNNFGEMLAELLPSNLINPARWHKTLSEISRVSPVHALVIQKALQHCCKGDPENMPRNYAKLLELLLELSMELSLNITNPQCLEFLHKLKGSSKAAKLAKSLLTLPIQTFTDANRHLMQSVVKQRLLAVQRWM